MNDPLILGVWVSSTVSAPVIAYLVVRRLLRLKRRQEAAASRLERDDTGVMTVPVVATFTGVKGWPALIALASNSLNPVLTLRPDRMDYRVTRSRVAAFEQVESVRLVTAPGTVNLVFVFSTGPFTFSASVGTANVAQIVLDSYPELAAKRIFESPR